MVITVFQAIILGLIQGFTELFPISSLGHSVIIPQLFNWDIHQNDSYFLTFLVATHLATALVLFLFFWKEWAKVLRSLGRSLKNRSLGSDAYAKLGWLLVLGTVPAGLLGFLFQDSLRRFFASAQYAAGFLVINGFILLLAERLRQNNTRGSASAAASSKSIAKLRWPHAVYIGGAQAAALFPGISRSGASMAGGLLFGLNNEDSARFSFMLATPVIGAAALLKLPELFKSSAAAYRGATIAGAICAALAAYVSVRFLVKYFQTKTLKPFAVYCLAAGVILSLYFAIT